MVQAYNFLASWQLFPEKCRYESGERPKSGTYRVDITGDPGQLAITQHRLTLENEALSSHYLLKTNGQLNRFEITEMADEVKAGFTDQKFFEIQFYKNSERVLWITHEIMPDGYLKLIQHGFRIDGTPYTNTEYYHKQLHVLPYASSVSGAVIRPIKEGVIKHKALMAMEEQTQMQLDQIREQIELLASQAQKIQQRKELSLKILEAKISFRPRIGQTYHLYQHKDNSYQLLLLSPAEWDYSSHFSQFIATVKLLADHTWQPCS